MTVAVAAPASGFVVELPGFSGTLAELASALRTGRIPPQAVIGHSDMAPGRKSDPGARFDWARLARSGLAVWPDPAAQVAPQDFAGFAQRFGYPPVDDAALLAAFRLRFRPNAKGPLDRHDASLAKDLATRFAVEHGPAKA